MIIVILLQLTVVSCIVFKSRNGLENGLPCFCFFLVLMPLEAKIKIFDFFDVNIMRVSLITISTLYLFKQRKNRTTKLPLKQIILIHIALVSVSSILSLSFAISLKQMLSQILEYYLLYFIFVRSITKMETVHKIVVGMISALGLCCIFSIIEVYAHWSVLRIFPRESWITYNGGLDPLYSELGRGLRVRSTFPHPILFGDALSMAIPLNLYFITIIKKLSLRVFLWLTLVLMIWSLYRTFSRGPWIASIFSFLLLYLFLRGRIRKYLLVITSFSIAALFIRPGIWYSAYSLYQSTTDPSTPVGTSYLYRDALNKAVLTAVSADFSRFLFGYGLGTFRVLGLDINFLGSRHHWYTCDNNWAMFLYETGFVGLTIMIILMGKVLFVTLKNYCIFSYPHNELSGVLFISLIVFCFLLLSVAGYSWGQQGYMAWIVISLAICQIKIYFGQICNKNV